MKAVFKRFFADRKGNTVVIFGLVALLLAAAVGGGIDFSTLSNHKQRAQDALDAAALAAAVLRPATVEAAQTDVTDKFKRNLGNEFDGIKIKEFKYNVNDRTYYVKATASYKTVLIGLVGINQIDYEIETKTIQAANGTLELALVLDNTWSMSNKLDGTKTRLDVLKTAANNLVNTVMTDANKDYVKVAVVPYADYVNVGTGNRTQTWLSVAADYSTTSTKTCTKSTTKTTCTGGTIGTCTRVRDGITESYSCYVVAQTCTTKTVPESKPAAAAARPIINGTAACVIR
ncbi:MAG: VWA domain-containing protein [Asticcacaulis sp.]